jgi:hypothetical protein
MHDDGARGAEITVEDGQLPYCSDCQVKHAADLLAHVDPKGDREKYDRAEWMFDRVSKEVGMSKVQADDYRTIRELEHKFEDGLTVLRDLRHRVQANPGVDNPIKKEKVVIHLPPEREIEWTEEELEALGKETAKKLQHKDNPGPRRQYLPYGLTEKEKRDLEERKLLSRCIKSVEKKQCPPDFKGNYSLCSANPVAVCRASVTK